MPIQWYTTIIQLDAPHYVRYIFPSLRLSASTRYDRSAEYVVAPNAAAFPFKFANRPSSGFFTLTYREDQDQSRQTLAEE